MTPSRSMTYAGTPTRSMASSRSPPNASSSDTSRASRLRAALPGADQNRLSVVIRIAPEGEEQRVGGTTPAVEAVLHAELDVHERRGCHHDRALERLDAGCARTRRLLADHEGPLGARDDPL